MMCFPLKEKFIGLNSDGLTFEESIVLDVRNNIKSLLFNINSVVNNKNNDELIIGGISRSRFILSRYYYKYLDEYLSKELAEQLKEEIEEKIIVNELLNALHH